MYLKLKIWFFFQNKPESGKLKILEGKTLPYYKVVVYFKDVQINLGMCSVWVIKKIEFTLIKKLADLIYAIQLEDCKNIT